MQPSLRLKWSCSMSNVGNRGLQSTKMRSRRADCLVLGAGLVNSSLEQDEDTVTKGLSTQRGFVCCRIIVLMMGWKRMSLLGCGCGKHQR